MPIAYPQEFRERAVELARIGAWAFRNARLNPRRRNVPERCSPTSRVNYDTSQLVRFQRRGVAIGIF